MKTTEYKICFATKGVETCGRRLPITEFHFRNTTKGIRQNQCNDCKNRKDLKKKSITIQIKKSFIRRIENKAQCIVSGCSAKNNYKVDWANFDHIEPSNKINDVSYMVKGKNKATVEDVLNEIHKCNIVCLTHHKWHTNLQGATNPKYEDEGYYMISKDSMELVSGNNWVYSIHRKKQNDKVVIQAYEETLEKEDLSKAVRWS